MCLCGGGRGGFVLIPGASGRQRGSESGCWQSNRGRLSYEILWCVYATDDSENNPLNPYGMMEPNGPSMTVRPMS